MLPRSHRLASRAFINAKKHGHQIRYSHLSLISVPNSLAHSRFAVVTPLSISKKAVIRNRLRRILYDQLRNSATEKLSYDIIVYPRASMLNLTREAIGSVLNSYLSALTPA